MKSALDFATKAGNCYWIACLAVISTIKTGQVVVIIKREV